MQPANRVHRLFVDSRFKNSNDSHTNFSIHVPRISHIRGFQVRKFIAPNYFNQINDGNNLLYIVANTSKHTIKIDVTHFLSITHMATWLQDAINPYVSVTVDVVNNRLRITNNSAIQLSFLTYFSDVVNINNGAFMFGIMGPTDFDVFPVSSTTAQYPTLYPMTYVYIKSSLSENDVNYTGVNNYGTSEILHAIPLNVPIGNIIFYENTSDQTIFTNKRSGDTFSF